MKETLTSSHYLEIRYAPMGSFLNVRGEVADFLAGQKKFRHWEITANRVDFWNAEDRRRDPETAFVSFRNCGYLIHNPSTEDYFADHSSKFLSILEKFEGFSYPPILRLGVRSRFYLPVSR